MIETIAARDARQGAAFTARELRSEGEVTAPRYLSTEGDAFMRMVHTFDALPAISPLTRDDVEALAKRAQTDAEDAYIARVASWY